mgnify:FL=1
MSANIDLFDYPLQRGDTYPFDLTWYDSNGPIDMRGKTLVLTLKITTFNEDDAADAQKTVLFATSDGRAEVGRTVITLDAQDTASLTPSLTYFYALRVLDAGTERTYLNGKLPVEDA